MRFRSLARHLIAVALAATPGCIGPQTPDRIEQPPPPPPPPPLADASGYQYTSQQVSVYVTHRWTKDGASTEEFPEDLVVGWRPLTAIDRAHPIPLGVVVSVDDARARSETPAEQAVHRVLEYYDGDAVAVRPIVDGFLVTLLTQPGECIPSLSTSYVVPVADGVVTDGVVEVHQTQTQWTHCTPARGRRPPGLRSVAASSDFLTEAAHLEAASVPAFERLASELEALDAPRSLIARARRAAADEVRHAAAMHALGARPTRVELAAVPTRDAFALALDNAVEGCVEEAFAAVLCAYQAAHAADPALAAAMTSIADDECDHADLALDLARWLEPRLSPADRAAVSAAVDRALASLPARAAAESTRHPSPALGLPPPAVAATLARAFAAHVLAAR